MELLGGIKPNQAAEPGHWRGQAVPWNGKSLRRMIGGMTLGGPAILVRTVDRAPFSGQSLPAITVAGHTDTPVNQSPLVKLRRVRGRGQDGPGKPGCIRDRQERCLIRCRCGSGG